MQLQTSQPQEVISSSWLDSYEKEIEALWWQLVQLNSSVFVLEELAAFPFDLFQPMLGPFWRLARASLFETSVMIIWRLVDPKEKTLTLPHFRDSIRDNLEDRYHSQLDDALRAMNFDGVVSRIRERVLKIRHNQLAHFQRKWIVDPSPRHMKERFLSVAELSHLRDELNTLFDLLCFGSKRGFLPPDYDSVVQHPEGADTRSDIERLLDGIAKENPLLNMPEEQSDAWPHFRKDMPAETLEVLNSYRLKFGLPKV